MRFLGVEEVKRTKRLKTTTPDPAATKHPDLVKRNFTATAPNQLWVNDLTVVPIWTSVAYVCFTIDAYPSTVVGWRVASHMKTETTLDVIEMARWSQGKHLPGLRCRADAGSQFASIRYGEDLEGIGAVPSIETLSHSFDNALAETANNHSKAEPIGGPDLPGSRKVSKNAS